MELQLPLDFKEFLSLLNLDHLKVNKKASRRYKDLNDLENLP
jgi:hypothetical protein